MSRCQAQVLNLLDELRAPGPDLQPLFISHDLKVVRQMSTRVAVRYLGASFEAGLPEDVFRPVLNTLIPKALVSAIPTPARRGKRNRIRP